MNFKRLLQLAVGLTITVLLLTACGGLEAGQVKGKLVDSNGRPVQASIFLGEPTSKTSVRANAELFANTDGSGVFMFENVQPGEYALAAMVTIGVISPLTDEKGEIIVFEMTEEKGIDLGKIVLKIQ
jgi:hypothetical protein